MCPMTAKEPRAMLRLRFPKQQIAKSAMIPTANLLFRPDIRFHTIKVASHANLFKMSKIPFKLCVEVVCDTNMSSKFGLSLLPR